jgi:quinol-cytochrome oxidoreductase complex cytochrome b subunit
MDLIQTLVLIFAGGTCGLSFLWFTTCFVGMLITKFFLKTLRAEHHLRLARQARNISAASLFIFCLTFSGMTGIGFIYATATTIPLWFFCTFMLLLATGKLDPPFLRESPS